MGYLVQLAAAIATGFPCPVISTGKDEEETEKRLGAALLAGHAILSMSPFIVIALFQSYKIAGVLSLMIVLLLIQILAV